MSRRSHSGLMSKSMGSRELCYCRAGTVSMFIWVIYGGQNISNVVPNLEVSDPKFPGASLKSPAA
jgi:hypothetical protein